jgi:hypothetical protein
MNAKNMSGNLHSVFVFFLLLLLAVGSPSCKTKQKAAEREAAELLAKQTEQAKKDLISLLSDNNSMTLEEKEAALQRIKDLGLQDPEVLDLIQRVEEKLAAERAEADRIAEEASAEERRKAELQAKQRGLNGSIRNIASSSSTSTANRQIAEALKLFSSDNAPVLIVIAEENGQKDYDRPTTIREYLEHVKDTGSVEETVSHMKFDDQGLISELEMIKN